MAYTIVDPQPPLRDSSLSWGDVGPGLYNDGEVLVSLDTHFAAASVKTQWLDSGAGASLTAVARWCDATGQTQLCPDGCHVETTFSHTADPSIIASYGIAALAKDMLLLVLGEEPLTLTADGSPLINLSEDVKLNIGIRHAISIVEATSSLANSKVLLS